MPRASTRSRAPLGVRDANAHAGPAHTHAFKRQAAEPSLAKGAKKRAALGEITNVRSWHTLVNS